MTQIAPYLLYAVSRYITRTLVLVFELVRACGGVGRGRWGGGSERNRARDHERRKERSEG